MFGMTTVDTCMTLIYVIQTVDQLIAKNVSVMNRNNISLLPYAASQEWHPNFPDKSLICIHTKIKKQTQN